MTDIALNITDNGLDLAVVNNDLATDEGLETAVLLSLFTDRRAEDGDVLPDAQRDRRGWWGDALPVEPVDKFGSRLWLLAREKQTQSVLDRAREYAAEALKWLVDDRVAARVDVTADWLAPGALALGVVIHRPAADAAEYRFNYNWAAQEARH